MSVDMYRISRIVLMYMYRTYIKGYLSIAYCRLRKRHRTERYLSSDFETISLNRVSVEIDCLTYLIGINITLLYILNL